MPKYKDGRQIRNKRLIMQLTESEDQFLKEKAKELGYHGRSGMVYRHLKETLFPKN